MAARLRKHTLVGTESLLDEKALAVLRHNVYEAQQEVRRIERTRPSDYAGAEHKQQYNSQLLGAVTKRDVLEAKLEDQLHRRGVRPPRQAHSTHLGGYASDTPALPEPVASSTAPPVGSPSLHRTQSSSGLEALTNAASYIASSPAFQGAAAAVAATPAAVGSGIMAGARWATNKVKQKLKERRDYKELEKKFGDEAFPQAKPSAPSSVSSLSDLDDAEHEAWRAAKDREWERGTSEIRESLEKLSRTESLPSSSVVALRPPSPGEASPEVTSSSDEEQIPIAKPSSAPPVITVASLPHEPPKRASMVSLPGAAREEERRKIQAAELERGKIIAERAAKLISAAYEPTHVVHKPAAAPGGVVFPLEPALDPIAAADLAAAYKREKDRLDALDPPVVSVVRPPAHALPDLRRADPSKRPVIAAVLPVEPVYVAPPHVPASPEPSPSASPPPTPKRVSTPAIPATPRASIKSNSPRGSSSSKASSKRSTAGAVETPARKSSSSKASSKRSTAAAVETPARRSSGKKRDSAAADSKGTSAADKGEIYKELEEDAKLDEETERKLDELLSEKKKDKEAEKAGVPPRKRVKFKKSDPGGGSVVLPRRSAEEQRADIDAAHAELVRQRKRHVDEPLTVDRPTVVPEKKPPQPKKIKQEAQAPYSTAPRLEYHIPHHTVSSFRWHEPSDCFNAPQPAVEPEHGEHLGGLTRPKVVTTTTTTTY